MLRVRILKIGMFHGTIILNHYVAYIPQEKNLVPMSLEQFNEEA